MSLSEATALTNLVLERFDPQADQQALARLAAWCEQFSPLVAIEQPDCLLMDVTGLGRLFGSEEALAMQIRQAFQRIGLKTRIAVTDTFAAAWSLSHYHEREFLLVPAGEVLSAIVDLPVASLNLSEAMTLTLHELGIDHIEQLLKLPRAELAARFDPELFQRLDEATGHVQQALTPCHGLPDLACTFAFEDPVEDRFLLEEVIGELLKQVLPRLQAGCQGITKFVCQFKGEFPTDVQLTIALYQATASLKHLCELVALQLEKLSLPGPVGTIRLLVCSTALLPTEQLELFEGENTTNDKRHLSLLVNRLISRLGPISVVKAIPLADAQAEYAYRYQPLTCKQRPTKQTTKRCRPHQRPLQLLPAPTPLKVLGLLTGPPKLFHWQGQRMDICHASGPERIEAGWWRGHSVKRDYYRVETNHGNRFWLFRDRQGDWFLHGIFD